MVENGNKESFMHFGQINTNRDWGGGENQILHLMQSLTAMGEQVTLFAHPDGELLRRARALGFADAWIVRDRIESNYHPPVPDSLLITPGKSDGGGRP
jgi:hypothetical protein